MADIADIAHEQEELQRQSALAQATKSTKSPTATGRCLECDAPLPHGMRWCDAICRDDWERANT